MCGFLGIVGGAKPQLNSALKFIGRRGPDSHREWSSSDGSVQLLHARLAIVDTDSRSHQPFHDERTGVVVAFNGEIYNYRELRKELSSHEFRTTSDTEVIATLFTSLGLAGLKKLRGMFSMSIVDTRARRVYLARDPIGKKPLFLSDWSGGAYFGSSVLALCAASGHQPELDLGAAAEYWQDGHVSPEQSLLRGCKPIRPGQVIELDWEGRVMQTSSCVAENSIPREKDLEGNQRIVSDLIQQAVQRRLLNNPNPVALLSGGIDSTVVSSHMKNVAGGSAITLGSLIPKQNDEKYARYAAKRLDLPLQIVRARTNRLAEDVQWALDLQDEPLGMISYFPLALMIRAAKDYGRILLTGDGGDEVFLGYGTPEKWIAKSNGTTNGNHQEWLSDWGQRMVSSSLVGHMFTKLDRAAAEQGVETRSPLLDWDLVSFVRQLGPDQMFFDGRTKALLKAELASWPSSFIDRSKVGFAYNLRWLWAASRFAGLREMVDYAAIERFSNDLPVELRVRPSAWTTLGIFKNFPVAWKLLAWSRFSKRLQSSIDAEPIKATNETTNQALQSATG